MILFVLRARVTYYLSAFLCDYAANQISIIGSYTNTMVQYRDGGNDGISEGPARWQYLAPGFHDSPVECHADSGVHGDGRRSHLWAANGTNLNDPLPKSPKMKFRGAVRPAILVIPSMTAIT